MIPLLDQIDIGEVNAKISQNNEAIQRGKDAEEENEYLKYVVETAEGFLHLKRILDSPLCTQQSRRYHRLMVEHPLLTWSLIEKGGLRCVKKYCDMYEDATLFEGIEGNPSFADVDEKNLMDRGYTPKIEKILKDFKLKEVSLV